MNCPDVSNDLLIAPTAAVSAHIASCDVCHERQRAVILAQRALMALAGEGAFPEKNDAAIRAAIPALAAAASTRRPAGWWQVAAAAAVLFAAVAGALQFAGKREEPRRAAEPPAIAVKPPDEGRTAPPEEIKPPPPDPVKPPPDPVPDPEPKVQPPDPAPPVMGHKDPPPPDPVPVPPQPDPAPPIILKGPKIEDSSIADSMLIMKGLLGEAEAVDRDFNGDGVTDVADAMLAARHAAEAGSPR